MGSRKKRAVTQTLENIPSTLQILYENAFPRGNQLATELFQCLLAATRPLSLSEINVVLGMGEDVESLAELEGELEADIEHTIKTLGGFFLRIIGHHVHFVHQTARQFLLRSDSINPSSLGNNSSVNLLKSNQTLSQRCVRFLLLPDWVAYGKRCGKGWKPTLKDDHLDRDLDGEDESESGSEDEDEAEDGYEYINESEDEIRSNFRTDLNAAIDTTEPEISDNESIKYYDDLLIDPKYGEFYSYASNNWFIHVEDGIEATDPIDKAAWLQKSELRKSLETFLQSK
ncbi:hypothetical protein QBC38DRAFT_167933 [Podospora fimiseda]|uniref:Uncharacterized protein n=1 Tax=Podospora fimiseda TaxID=252190 RepID=A0AAN7GZZ6_9PEZI|nr:hypothetical protein QBC38DRAFT_167933 [Podospora fimiseda]